MKRLSAVVNYAYCRGDRIDIGSGDASVCPRLKKLNT